MSNTLKDSSSEYNLYKIRVYMKCANILHFNTTMTKHNIAVPLDINFHIFK